MFSADDSRHMARALKLASRGRKSAHPNPMVGCVMVRDGDVIGEGWHRRTGEDHAEVIALRAAGDKAAGATVYVSLEPCSHHGRTPPCADALVRAGVARVVAAMQDPNPEVSGRGFEVLRSAGIDTSSGLFEPQAVELNRGYVKRMRTGRPWLILKMAASLDGATAMESGESQWITGPEALADVHELRRAAGAIMTGVGTIIADDPRLTARTDDTAEHQPLRIVLDSDLKTPASAEVLKQPGETRIYYCGDPVRDDLEDKGATLVPVASASGGVSIGDVLDDLGVLEINNVLVEAGAKLAGSIVTAGLVDEIVLYQAPQFLGSETRPLLETPAWTRLAHRLKLAVIETRVIGQDVRTVLRPSRDEDT